MIMVKIDGSQRIICALLVLYSVTAAASEQLRLQIKSMSGKVVDTVAVGEFFTVCVTILDSTIRDTPSHISTDPVIPLRWSGKVIERVDSTHMANQYQYRGYVDTPGDYLIGPATVKGQAGTVTSGTCILHVDEQGSKKTGQSVAPHPRLVLEIPESKIVVGQRIPVVLTFYYTDKSTRIVNTMQESLADITLRDQERTLTGTKELDGSTYYFVQFNLYLTAHKAGSFSIPAFCVDYQVEQREKRTMGFGFFELTQYENKRVYSNMCKLQVEQLPPHQKTVFAVGTFDTLKLSAQPTTAQQGEAIALTLEVTGDTDWDLLHAPTLENIPHGLRCYDSQESLMPDRQNLGRMIKRFEYVVQGLQQGAWTIPAQKFTIFDTAEKKYKTVQSDQVTVVISKDDALVMVSSDDTHTQELSSQTHSDVQEGIDLPLHEQGPWSSHSAREPLSISFFILLLLIPFMCMCCILYLVIS